METPEQFWSRHTVHDQPFTSRKESDEYNRKLYEEYRMSRDLLFLDDSYHGWFVLDYGCGPGNDTVEFAKSGANVLSVDISAKALGLAQQRVSLYGFKTVAFKQIGANGKVMKSEACIDRAHCNGVLHHIEDPKPQIDEMYRLLRPGGYATMMVYNRESVFYHLYIAYVVRFLNPHENGVKISGRFTPSDSVDFVFGKTTDGLDCPVSKAYGREFMDLLPGKVSYGGSFFCTLDIKPFFDQYFWRAIQEPGLEKEHKEFLSSIEWRGELGFVDAMPCGALSVYHMAKESR